MVRAPGGKTEKHRDLYVQITCMYIHISLRTDDLQVDTFRMMNSHIIPQSSFYTCPYGVYYGTCVLLAIHDRIVIQINGIRITLSIISFFRISISCYPRLCTWLNAVIVFLSSEHMKLQKHKLESNEKVPFIEIMHTSLKNGVISQHF